MHRPNSHLPEIGKFLLPSSSHEHQSSSLGTNLYLSFSVISMHVMPTILDNGLAGKEGGPGWKIKDCVSCRKLDHR